MSEENAIRVDRIKKILGVETDVELAELCESYQSRVSSWRRKGFTKPFERLLDLLLDKYDQDKRPRRGRPPKLSIGQRIREVRKERRMNQRDFGELIYGKGLNDNTYCMRVSPLERSKEIDANTLELVAKALKVMVDEL
jgi:hypothetical protein